MSCPKRFKIYRTADEWVYMRQNSSATRNQIHKESSHEQKPLKIGKIGNAQ